MHSAFLPTPAQTPDNQPTSRLTTSDAPIPLSSSPADITHAAHAAPTATQFARLARLQPETREAILKRVQELQAKIPPMQLNNQQLWLLYLEAADQIIDEIPGRINPLLIPEKILLFLVDLQNQLQN